MKAIVFVLCLSPFAASAASEAECKRMAGDPGNPTYDSVFRQCMKQPAKPSAAAGASRARTKEEECKTVAGDSGNPTYEAVFKKCLTGKR
jgi:hypothetical protein